MKELGWLKEKDIPQFVIKVHEHKIKMKNNISKKI